MGWKNSVFFHPKYLAAYEDGISSELSIVTIISHSLAQDSPGGALYETVASNLNKGIIYNYIFLDSANAYSMLRKIYYSHDKTVRKNLCLEYAEETFWALGTYSNVTIYEFNSVRRPEGYIRILANTPRGIEYPVYIKMSESFVDTVFNHVESFRNKNLIKKYEG